MADPVRCAVYTRKSSEEGLEQSFNSLHAQREACEAYVTSQKHEGWRLIATAYDDGGFSGGSMERPGLKCLMADVAGGLIDTVVVYKVDRLTRSLADFAKMVELFDAHKVSFVSVTQAFNTTTSMGRLTLNVLLSFAQFEREVTGERIRDKIAASKAKGMWMGGLVPLGYDVVERQLIVNEAEAEQVRTLFALYAKARAVDDVVIEAAALGIVSKRRLAGNGQRSGGGRLGRGSLYAILANPLYAGEIGHKGKTYPGQHAAIVAPKLFATVQRILSENRRKEPGQGTRRSPTLLGGLVADPDGHAISATFTTRRGRRYHYYANAEIRLPAAELDALVATAIGDALGSPSALAKALPDLALLTPELIDAAAALAQKANAHLVVANRDTLRAAIRAVVVGDKTVTVTIAAEALDLSSDLMLAVPTEIGRTRKGLTLIVNGIQPPRVDQPLVRLVAEARRWVADLTSGRARSVTAVAVRAKVSEAYVRGTIGAAFLAPDLVEQIVEGRQPAALGVDALKAMLPLPKDWDAQRAMFAALG